MSFYQKFKVTTKRVKRRKIGALFAIGVIAILGGVIISQSFASSLFVTFEAEDGTTTSEVQKIGDSSASNNSYIKFGANSSSNDTGKFIRTVDVGPQAATYGHTPYGALKEWTGGNTITDSSAQRNSDGWMVLKGYSFKGPLYIKASKVALVDCTVTYDDSVKNGSFGTVTLRPGSSPYYIDHCKIDQGNTGWSNAAIDARNSAASGTVRYSRITGTSDGIAAGRDSLFEYNYIDITGIATENETGHIDGIQGEYFKFNWIARHNTILSGVTPDEDHIAAGAMDGPELGGNIGIYAPTTKNGSVGPSGAEGVVAENNYINGFNTGISIQGTNPNNPAIIRNNEIGPNMRYYPVFMIRIWQTGQSNQKSDYVILDNNFGDRLLDKNTGNTSAYNGTVGKISDFSGASYTGEPNVPPTPQL